MKRAQAFSPAHITGFFKIYKSGSTGAGITLEHGLFTEVKVDSGNSTKIYINNQSKQAEVSKNVISMYRKLAGDFSVNVNHITDVPIGYGLGMSAAGSLSLSLALADCLGVVTELEAKTLAHMAEIECKTGLGGVIAESIGSLVIRKKSGSFKDAEKIALQDEHITCFFLNSISTKRIITDNTWKNRINSTADLCLSSFLKDKSLRNFFNVSRNFALGTGLANGLIKKIILKNENCSMAMLGRTIFSLGKQKVIKTKNKLITKLSNKKAHLL